MSSITYTHASAAQRLPTRTAQAEPARGMIKRVLPLVLAWLAQVSLMMIDGCLNGEHRAARRWGPPLAARCRC